jgi:hypothetical protein
MRRRGRAVTPASMIRLKPSRQRAGLPLSAPAPARYALCTSNVSSRPVGQLRQATYIGDATRGRRSHGPRPSANKGGNSGAGSNDRTAESRRRFFCSHRLNARDDRRSVWRDVRSRSILAAFRLASRARIVALANARAGAFRRWYGQSDRGAARRCSLRGSGIRR